MSPSRGSVNRLSLFSIAIAKPHSSIQRYIAVSPSSILRRTSHAAFSLSLPRDSSNQDDFGGTSNDEIHPDGIDQSLFEHPTNEYKAQIDATSKSNHDSWQSGPSQLLLSLLTRSTREATTTLKELNKLDTRLEKDYAYARPARQCAVDGDYKGFFGWLNIVPHFNLSTNISIQEKEQLCKHIAGTLTALINGNAEPYIVCLALLKIIDKGFIESGDDTGKAIFQSLTWLVRHGKVAEDKGGQEWTWQLWTSLSKIAKESKAKSTPSTSRVTLDEEDVDKELSSTLTRLYNGCVRSLVQAGRYEAATMWVQRSDSFGLKESNRGTILQPFTWRIFLEEVLDIDSPATSAVRSQAGALAATLKEKIEKDPQSHHLKKLVREMDSLVLDRNNEVITEEASLDDRVTELLDQDDTRGAIALLYEALMEPASTPRWGHLPKALTLALVRESVSKRHNSQLSDELQLYFEKLEKSKGAKGLIPFSSMVHLSRTTRHAECVSLCISTYQSREVEHLAMLVDKNQFEKTILETKEVDKLRDNKYANYLALKSLALMCKHDFFKLHKLYRSWLQISVHHLTMNQVVNDSTDKVAAEAQQVEDEIFESANLEYHFRVDATLPEEDESKGQRLLLHQGPPVTRPSAYHFNLFLKMLPKSFAITALKGNSSVKALLQGDDDDVSRRTVELGFSIIQEMEKFKVEPSASTWSILLTLLARSINANPSVDERARERRQQDEDQIEEIATEYDYQWNRLWKLTSALGMGQELNSNKSSSSTFPSSPLPRATTLTYLNLIYAFLMVTPSRGGPCLQEANQVKQWLEADKVALANKGQYERPYNRVMRMLEKVEARTVDTPRLGE